MLLLLDLLLGIFNWIESRGFKKNTRAIGLGYDGTTDDYKAVVILKSRETHVYSLKSDSWRIVMNCPCPQCDHHGPGVFVCGALNWLSVGKGGAYEDMIVALDLGTQKFSLLQMPKTRWNKPKNPPAMLLNVLGGRLALSDSGYDKHLDVWVMKDEESWIKLFSIERSEQQYISTFTGFLRPVAFMMKEKSLVFLQDIYKRFFLFDFETKSLKCVEFGGSIIDGGGSDSFLYAQQMFVGHANCGGAIKSLKKKKRKITSCTKKKKKFGDVE